MKCQVAYLTSDYASFSRTQCMELRFYSVCEKCPPTRAGSSRCVWGLDRSWYGWHSPGAWLPRCQPDVSAMSPRQTHRTEREKITSVIYCSCWLGFLYMFVCLNWILQWWLWVDCIFDRLGYGCQSRFYQFLHLYHGNTGNTCNFMKDLWVQC